MYKRDFLSCTRSSRAACPGPSSPISRPHAHMDFRTCELLTGMYTNSGGVTSPVHTSKSTEAEILIDYKQKKQVASALYIEQ